MLKRICIGLILVLFIVLPLVVSSHLERTFEDCLDLLSSAEHHYKQQDYGAALEKARELKDYLDEHAVLFGSLLEHDEIDKIHVAVEELTANLQAKNDTLIPERLARTRYLFEHVTDMMEVRLENIF